MKLFQQYVISTIVTTLSIFLCVVHSSSANDCENLETAKLDDKWIDSRKLEERWYVALSSKLETWYPPDWNANPSPQMTPKTPARRCYDASILTPKGRVHVPFVCGFFRHEIQNCVLRTEETRLKRKLRLAGDFRITKSDNATYYVMLGCIEDEKKFWFVLSRKRALPANVTEEVLDHVRSMGFDQTDLSDKYDDRFAFHKLRSRKCRRVDYPDYDGTEEEEKRLALGNSTSISTTEKSSSGDDKDDDFLSSIIKTVTKLLGGNKKHD